MEVSCDHSPLSHPQLESATPADALALYVDQCVQAQAAAVASVPTYPSSEDIALSTRVDAVAPFVDQCVQAGAAAIASALTCPSSEDIVLSPQAAAHSPLSTPSINLGCNFEQSLKSTVLMSSQPSQPVTPNVQKLLDLELDASQSMDKIEDCDHVRLESSRTNISAAMAMGHVSSPEPRRSPSSGFPAWDQQGCLAWDVVLEKTEGVELGLTFSNGKAHFSMSRQVPAANEKGPETLIINMIKPGSCLDDWNTVHPKAAVKIFDRITDVNGHTTLKEMQEELLNSSVLLMRIVRYPSTFDIHLEPLRDEVALLGLRFSPQSYSQQELSISKVAETGRIEQHNQISIEQGLFHIVVTPGMLVEAINGHCGSARDLQRYLTEAGSGPLKLRMRRNEMSHTLAAKEDPSSAPTSAPSSARDGSLTSHGWSRPTTASKSSRPTTASKSRPTTASKSRPGPALPGYDWKGNIDSEVVVGDSLIPLLTEISQEEEVSSPLGNVSAENEPISPGSNANLREIVPVQSREIDKNGLTSGSTPSYTVPNSMKSALAGNGIHAGQQKSASSSGGCLKWEVVLQKRDPTDRFGFSHISGAEQFLKARGARVMGAASSFAQRLPLQAPEVLIIREIAPSGLLAEWSRSRTGLGGEVVLGDRVASVNGISSVEAMQEQLKTSQRCVLSLVRYPPKFIAKLPGLSNQRRSLGLKFDIIGNGFTGLRITGVARDGLVEEYNQFHLKHGRFHLVITAGMVVLSVNQAQGSSEQMLRVLSQAPSLTLLICRSE